MIGYRGRIVSGGRLQIPADVRKKLGFADGDKVRLEVVDGESHVRSQKAAIRAIQAELRRYVPEGVSLSDELIAERRAEAREIEFILDAS